jgi:DNA-binding FadR family transcriptional regulator
MMTNDEDQTTGMTREEIREALEELERLGLAKKTGEFRDGRPVYVAIEYRGGTA